MGKENERGLILIGSTRELARVSQRDALDLVIKFNSEFYSFFEIEKLLQTINERVFGGKGKVKPATNGYELQSKEPVHKGGKKSSRFDRLFSVEAEFDSAGLTAELEIERDKIPGKQEIPYLDSIVLRVYQNVDMEEKSMSLKVVGQLQFKRLRSLGGSWDGKAFYLKQIGQSKGFSFSLEKPPSLDEISLILMQNTQEILGEFAKQDFISPIDFWSTTSEENKEQENIQ